MLALAFNSSPLSKCVALQGRSGNGMHFARFHRSPNFAASFSRIPSRPSAASSVSAIETVSSAYSSSQKSRSHSPQRRPRSTAGTQIRFHNDDIQMFMMCGLSEHPCRLPLSCRYHPGCSSDHTRKIGPAYKLRAAATSRSSTPRSCIDSQSFG